MGGQLKRLSIPSMRVSRDFLRDHCPCLGFRFLMQMIARWGTDIETVDVMPK